MTIKNKSVISNIVLNQDDTSIQHSACKDKDGNIYIPMYFSVITDKNTVKHHLFYFKINRFEDLPVVNIEEDNEKG